MERRSKGKSAYFCFQIYSFRRMKKTENEECLAFGKSEIYRVVEKYFSLISTEIETKMGFLLKSLIQLFIHS